MWLRVAPRSGTGRPYRSLGGHNDFLCAPFVWAGITVIFLFSVVVKELYVQHVSRKAVRRANLRAGSGAPHEALDSP